MSDEETERSFGFLKQQAQIATNLKNVSSNLQKVSSNLQKVTESQLRNDEALGTIIGLVGQLAGTQRQTAEAQQRIDQTAAETNGLLKSLIEAVKRYFSNGRGN